LRGVMGSPLNRLAHLVRGLGDLMGLTPLIDRLISQSEIVTIDGRKYVRKRYLKEVGIIKWIPPTILFRVSYPFTLSPRERFKRELDFMTYGWQGFVRTPKPVHVDEEKLEILREYVEGNVINYLRDSEPLGKALALIHSEGWALGDVKPTNFLVDNDSTHVYVIDAEQSVRTNNLTHKAWDIALSAFFASYAYLSDLTTYESFLQEFLREYVRRWEGGVAVLKELSSMRFGGIFLIMPLPHVFALADMIDAIIEEQKRSM